jgi:hypothetical protein
MVCGPTLSSVNLNFPSFTFIVWIYVVRRVERWFFLDSVYVVLYIRPTLCFKCAELL